MRVAILVLSALVPVFMAGCDYKPTQQSASGTYFGKYFGGIETIVLEPGGAFHQTFEKDGSIIYTKSGTWEIDESFIVIRPFVGHDVDPSSNQVSIMEYSVMMVSWSAPGPQLVFDETYDYWVTKVPATKGSAR